MRARGSGGPSSKPAETVPKGKVAGSGDTSAKVATPQKTAASGASSTDAAARHRGMFSIFAGQVPAKEDATKGVREGVQNLNVAESKWPTPTHQRLRLPLEVKVYARPTSNVVYARPSGLLLAGGNDPRSRAEKVAAVLEMPQEDLPDEWPRSAGDFSEAWHSNDKLSYADGDGILDPSHTGGDAKHNFYCCYANALTKKGCDKGINCRGRHKDLTVRKMAKICKQGKVKFLRDYAACDEARSHANRVKNNDGPGLPLSPLPPVTDADKAKLKAWREHQAECMKTRNQIAARTVNATRGNATRGTATRGGYRGGHGSQMGRPNPNFQTVLPGVVKSDAEYRRSA